MAVIICCLGFKTLVKKIYNPVQAIIEYIIYLGATRSLKDVQLSLTNAEMGPGSMQNIRKANSEANFGSKDFLRTQIIARHAVKTIKANPTANIGTDCNVLLRVRFSRKGRAKNCPSYAIIEGKQLTISAISRESSLRTSEFFEIIVAQ